MNIKLVGGQKAFKNQENAFFVCLFYFFCDKSSY